jgi:class 3 adenylate cyclase
MVQRRNDKLIFQAAQSNAIVSDVFPDAFRDRMFEQNNAERTYKKKQNSMVHDKALIADGQYHGHLGTRPVAELYPDATVIFADIVGFTAWSSIREPTQVFTLLEMVYNCFDAIANQRRIFKVETIGDCYVAVAGVPTPRKDHAVAACRFVRDILEKMSQLTKKLEVTLGPDTGDLTLRIGVHSGPVTAGVLRGVRSRFQLFGDTMNTTARIESTGAAGRIHLSQETANLLINASKQSWVEKREEEVFAKGKGLMQTYWLTSSKDRSDRTSSDGTGTCEQTGSNDLPVSELDNAVVQYTDTNQTDSSDRMNRLVDWNVGQLLSLLKQVVAQRIVSSSSINKITTAAALPPKVSLPIDEVQEIITLPEFDRTLSFNQQDSEIIEISPVVVAQLTLLVTWIASKYHNNPFHNFDHCSHVMMSVIKLLSRIVAPSELQCRNNMVNGASAASLHDHTYGITSDPLTQFACAYSALIHDLDHSGVPNITLVAEKAPIATQYNNRSVAEQNSFDSAWNELMSPQYFELRQTLFGSKADQCRFRQLVVNCVMATDIVDPDLKKLRNLRWERAFETSTNAFNAPQQDAHDVVNRKATIVIEHLIQASDVSHTMQHWNVFRKWNMNLFEEMYLAYVNGRSEKNPSEFWYQGEIGFFDNYIIPLAKKLKDCGVFGVSSDEYLNYAVKNRNEWETRGPEIVAEMVELMQERHRCNSTNVVDQSK